MQIEIAEPGRMIQTGSSLLRLIQNNNMPALDLLIRESIQNSLDARASNSRYVEMDFLTGHFRSEQLGKELDLLTQPLYKRYSNKECEFLAIRDSNTTGLTGVMDYKKVKNNDYGNLLKLVYEICKPQETEGAGGSWGIGKTVYFRVGIGLVIYYSRIKNDKGVYESRLAASLVENEMDSNAMIPVYNDMPKRGIAWWGERIRENVTQPVTDDEYIQNFLKIFEIMPYMKDETGTTIIIPYINPEALLSNNRIEYLNDSDKAIIPFWGYKIEDYLSIAAQRWYAPRLNNMNYQQGAYLRMRINDKGISYEDMEPVFKIIQSLYNRANYVDTDEDDILNSVETKKTEAISVYKYLEDKTVGTLAFAKVSKEVLHMNAPDNKPEPYIYFNNEIRDSDVNRPTICYTRKPAMIVAYENVGAWVSNIASTSKDEYILGIFVLSSFNKLKNSPTVKSLEEYIRKSEMADHTSWSDWSEGNYNPRFVSKIQSNVNKIIGREFTEVKENKQPKINSGLGKMFGDMLLPPEGFGKGAGISRNSTGNSQTGKRSRFKFAIDTSSITYSDGSMVIPMILRTSPKKKLRRAEFDMIIDSESKKIDINEWENKMCLETPFSIREYNIYIVNIDGKEYNQHSVMKADDSIEICGIQFAGKVTNKGTCHGLSIYSDEQHYVKININIIVDLNRNDIKPAFIFEKEE